MSKTRGGSRTLKSGSTEYRRRQAVVGEMRASGKYSSVEMTDKGGYVAIEASSRRHGEDEIAAAKILAEKGYKVVLKDEAGTGRTPDGYVFSFSYEQRTPSKDRAATIKTALTHARNKGADVAVIYSKDYAFSRQSVEDGIKLYEDFNTYKFKKIIVVADNGRIHRHKHNS